MNKRKIINATSHSIQFQSPGSLDTYEVPPCGIVLTAKSCEETVGVINDATLVQCSFKPSKGGLDLLDYLEEQHPRSIVVGSILTAQAFPGRVKAMVPVAGFERVPPAQRRMRDDKFIVFPSVNGDGQDE